MVDACVVVVVDGSVVVVVDVVVVVVDVVVVDDEVVVVETHLFAPTMVVDGSVVVVVDEVVVDEVVVDDEVVVEFAPPVEVVVEPDVSGEASIAETRGRQFTELDFFGTELTVGETVAGADERIDVVVID